MRMLYHLWLSPGSRKVRLALAEKGLEFSMKVEKVWERRPEFLALNPAGEVPVLVEPDGSVLADAVRHLRIPRRDLPRQAAPGDRSRSTAPRRGGSSPGSTARWRAR